MQSPIDIAVPSPDVGPDTDPVALDLMSTRWRVRDTGSTIEAQPVTEDGETAEGTAGGFTIAGTSYTVTQIHLHAPSEHTFGGTAADLELHVVATTPDGTTAVIGLPLTISGEGSALGPVFASIPTATASPGGVVLADPLDLADVLPTEVPAARYTGSLTTPPYTEGLQWTVYLTPLPVGAHEAAAFTAVYPSNARPTQLLHDRPVTTRTIVTA